MGRGNSREGGGWGHAARPLPALPRNRRRLLGPRTRGCGAPRAVSRTKSIRSQLRALTGRAGGRLGRGSRSRGGSKSCACAWRRSRRGCCLRRSAAPPPSHAVQRRAKRQIQRVQCTLWSPVRDAACPPSTRGGTRLVRLVRGRGGGNALCGERVSPLATGPKPAPPPPKPGAARGCAHRVRCEIFRGAARVTGAGALGSPAPLPY